MDYLILFLEGIITFISPCLLPMLPVYISYFAGQESRSNGGKAVLVNALGFVLGFTLIFVLLGAFAAAVGGLLVKYKTAVNIISGVLVVFFGLNFMGVIRLPFFNGTKDFKIDKDKLNFLSSILFGIIFSLGWTPCISTFLGSALMLAALSGESLRGILMLLCFSAGLGIPFVASALIINRLRNAFNFIKKHYKVINFISGLLLVIVGVLMATGLMGYLISL